MGLTFEDMLERDGNDPLHPMRARFELPDNIIYLDGNSLGVLPKGVRERLSDVVSREWGRDLIISWNRNGWMELPRRVGDRIARIIGAAPGEVIACDSTSLNVFKVLSAALAERPGRHLIVSDSRNFPTDLYMAEGLIRLLDRGYELRLIEDHDVAAALDADVAAVMLTHVDYRSGRMYDMPDVTAQVHGAGALMIWDLAHSAGALPVDLNAAGADFAVGCGYKYLNGGPGAPAFLFAATRWHEKVSPALSGWLGHDAPFAFETGYRPAQGIDRFIVGTPPVLSLSALDEALKVFDDVDMAQVRTKSVALCECFIELVESRLAGYGFTLASPRDSGGRGSQVSFAHEEGYAIMQALIARGVIGDFRAPDILRFGFTPLYISYAEVWKAVDVLADIMESGYWDRPEFKVRAKVT